MFIAKIVDWGPENVQDTNEEIGINFFNSSDGFHLIANNPALIHNNPVLKIYDMTGRVVKEIAITDSQMIIDNSTLAPGIYTWQIQDATEQLAAGKISTF
jgi:hypothetical protein